MHVEQWHLGLHETGVQPLLLVEKGWGPRLRFRQHHVLFLDMMARKEDHKKGEGRIIFCGFQDNVNLNVDANVSLFSFDKVLKVKYL